MIKHYNITVHGRVQGVGYRYFCLQHARKTGVKGFVKNMPDNTVSIEAEAEQTQLEIFFSHCSEGPPHANVTDITKSESPPEHYSDFKVKH